MLSSFVPFQRCPFQFDAAIFDIKRIRDSKMFMVDGSGQVQTESFDLEHLGKFLIQESKTNTLLKLFEHFCPLDPPTYHVENGIRCQKPSDIFTILRVDMTMDGKIDWHTDNHHEVYRGYSCLLPLNDTKSCFEIMVTPKKVASVELQKGCPLIFDQNVPHRVVSGEKSIDFFLSFPVDKSAIKMDNMGIENWRTYITSLACSSDFLELQQLLRDSMNYLVDCIKELKDKKYQNDIVEEIVSLHESLYVET